MQRYEYDTRDIHKFYFPQVASHIIIRLTFLNVVWPSITHAMLKYLGDGMETIIKTSSWQPTPEQAFRYLLTTDEAWKHLSDHMIYSIASDSSQGATILRFECLDNIIIPFENSTTTKTPGDRFNELWAKANEIGLTDSAMSEDTVQAIFESLIFGGG